MLSPTVIEHDGISVVRDDLIPGGTKARYIARLFDQGAREIVYASPAEGGAQTALATAAAAAGRAATIFVPKRQAPHPRSLMAKRLGAKVYQVAPGYMTVVSARARAYAAHAGALLAPFGMDMPEAIEVIADAARSTGLDPAEVWSAAGSGVLMRGLSLAWPKARRIVVQVGRKLAPREVAGAEIVQYPRPFGATARTIPPFPSDPHYDAKAWEVLMSRPRSESVLFWNVTGPAQS